MMKGSCNETEKRWKIKFSGGRKNRTALTKHLQQALAFPVLAPIIFKHFTNTQTGRPFAISG
jgi:hypothetical protein